MDHPATRLFVRNARDPEGGTLLHFLAGQACAHMAGCVDLARTAVCDLGIDAEDTNARGETALLVAVKAGRADLVEFFLGPEVGASGSARDSVGRGVHHWSTIYSTHADDDANDADRDDGMHMHRLLMTHRSTSRHMDSPDVQGITPLHLAALSGMLDVVGSYLSAGASVHSRCAWGRTALMEARCPAMARLLLGAGADVAAADLQGSTSIHWSAFRNSPGVLDELCAHATTCIDAQDAGGLTPLMEAARYGRRDAVRCLLRHGARADSLMRDLSGRTVLHHAARQDGDDAGEMFVDLLLAATSAGSSPDAPDVAGYAPLDGASDQVLQAAAEMVLFDRTEALRVLRDVAHVLDGNPDVANVVLAHRFVLTHWWLAEESRMS